MTPHEVNLLQDSGTAFGKNLLAATEDLVDASGIAGPGLNWKAQSDAFTYMLEKAEDCLSFYGDRAKAARAIFINAARIEFYGVNAPSSDRLKWRNAVGAARAELVTEAA